MTPNSERLTPNSIPAFSVLICFEDIFPGLARRFIQAGAAWILVITNDAWFKESAGSLQHLQASVFRAVENRVWIARAANTGWSGFIDPAGRLLEPLSRFEAGITAATVTASHAMSPYTRWGDRFLLICLGLLAAMIRIRRRNQPVN